MRVDVADVQNAVAGWIEANGMKPVPFYSNQQWRERGETLCQDAHLTAVIDGSDFGALLNSLGVSDAELYDSFVCLLESLGWMFELGYAWSVHFWPDPYEEANP